MRPCPREVRVADYESEKEAIKRKRKPYVYLSDRMDKWWMDLETIVSLNIVFIIGAILLWNYL
jgi:hypothetical protein